MPEDYDETLPPGPHSRRRATDHVNWRKIAIYVLGSLPISGPTMWKGVTTVLDLRDQWIKQQTAVVELQKVHAADELHEEKIQALERRVKKLERWKCVLGWNPPETKDPNRRCEED